MISDEEYYPSSPSHDCPSNNEVCDGDENDHELKRLSVGHSQSIEYEQYVHHPPPPSSPPPPIMRCLSVDSFMHQRYEFIPYGGIANGAPFFGVDRREVDFAIIHLLRIRDPFVLQAIDRLWTCLQIPVVVASVSFKTVFLIPFAEWNWVLQRWMEWIGMPDSLLLRCILFQVNHNYYSEYKTLDSTSILQKRVGRPSSKSLQICRQWCQEIRPWFESEASGSSTDVDGRPSTSVLSLPQQEFWNSLVRLRAFLLMTNDQLLRHGFYCPLAMRRYADDQRFQRENPHLSLPNRRLFVQDFHIQKYCNRCDCCYRFLSRKEVQRGHIVPKRWRGSLFSHNLLVLCPSCNSEMGSIDPHLHPHFFPQDRLEYLILSPAPTPISATIC